MFKTKRQKTISIIVFAIYMLLLIWLILFKFTVNLSELSRFRSINLIPFYASTMVNEKLELREIIYNVLVFAPLGVYLSVFKTNWSFVKKVIPCLCLSVFFEILQFLFAIGASDVTDIIGNTSGGMIGIAICTLLRQIFKDKSVTIINAIGLTIEILAALFLGILFVVNL